MQQEYQIKYLRAAMRDLEGIAQLYLGLAGADSAKKFIDEILHTVDLLRTFPYSGALHPDMVLAEREFRKVICRDYVCVYKVIDSEKTVYIYRIVPASQRGRTMPSHARRRLGRSGVEKPARMLFSRLPATGMSTVTTRVCTPAAITRHSKASMRSGVPGR